MSRDGNAPFSLGVTPTNLVDRYSKNVSQAHVVVSRTWWKWEGGVISG